ncbi:MAG: glycosyltransferase family 2 protein [Paraprevotella sp.]|nr:glycosyltransferase family 2 protein [Paraprevotella sp.]
MKLAIVVPCYNEEEMLPQTTSELLRVLDDLQSAKKIEQGIVLYVDDGSHDRTWQLICELASKYTQVKGLKLAHNAGHQQALWAGLEWAAVNADAAISIDADLQDDVDAIVEMVDAWRGGADVVFGVRKERKTDTLFKRHTAQGFYKLMNALGGEVVYNHADFRLMSRRTLQALVSFPERNLFLRGMVASLGYPTAQVFYDRKERLAGESKYPLSKMLSFALDGITSFSVRPLRYIVMLGMLFILISLAAIIYGVVVYFEGKTIPGWTSLLVSVWFIGGSILMAVGIIGEYIGKIYKEVKRRPRYFIEKEI